jgi:hypothetical protein
VDEVHEHEIEKCDKAAQQNHRDDDDESRVTELFVFAESFFLRVPWPGSFLQLDLHFVEEDFDFSDHSNSQKTSNAERRTSNAELALSEFDVGCSAFTVQRLQLFIPRQEGLEPPTGGFGDRYSTN